MTFSLHTMSSKPYTELWINICFVRLILQPRNLWLSQKAGKLPCLHLLYENKQTNKQTLFWSLLYAWGSRDNEVWQESQEEVVLRPELRRRNRKYFSCFTKREKCYHCFAKFFLRFLKVNAEGRWGRDFESEREKARNKQNFMTNLTSDREGPSLTLHI